VESKNGAQLQFLASLDFTVLVFAVPLYPEWRSEEPGYHSFGIEHMEGLKSPHCGGFLSPSKN
jgi:hypothetical protein